MLGAAVETILSALYAPIMMMMQVRQVSEILIGQDSGWTTQSRKHARRPWGMLFRGAPGFVSTTLMKDLKTPGRYMVADRWTSDIVYEEFKQAKALEYGELSSRGARLYASETEVGRFDFLE